ncbi:RAMP superfamily CRISPR-associated protein [Methanosalsum natronophilum]|uniref:RAMP superfamily CRISPR-associated protein n=1 Tax=Methanosalsum natronophilum TaxID=768733 RepID=UPI0021684127|nr:RAMP superfamily CRISPR-associated protein [Methanosalsum natronophilum]MCS3924842.1 CRISPR/Cas system CSM-associated protein Csm3 (group 7 of RAMP superfamily) [Methanosalsum natronophilum]
MNKAHWSRSRNISERLIISGTLVFNTPVAFGSNDDDGLVDNKVELDPLEGKALLTGSTIAGALRNYLREFENGYFNKGIVSDLSSKIFGTDKGDGGTEQSWLLTNDSIGPRPQLEIRDGVKINDKTRTAEDKKKFDFEMMEAGVKFDLEFEVLLPTNPELKKEILQGISICLTGLEKGEIMFGSRKNRGFGRCSMKGKWKLHRYDLSHKEGLIAWLQKDISSPSEDKFIANLLKSQETIVDKREYFLIDSIFKLDGSLLIRSDPVEPDSPDTVHLHSKRNNKFEPILSGTSLAGVLRARGLKIAKKMDTTGNAESIINDMFGSDNTDDRSISSSASKLIVHENVIENPLHLVQNRIKIDRFTGSSFPTALFNEQPIFDKNDTKVKIELILKSPKEKHIGLLLLLLKDLWTSDIAIGGETSVGRGRLVGDHASLIHGTSSDRYEWEFSQAGMDLNVVGDRDKLEGYIASFLQGVSA